MHVKLLINNGRLIIVINVNKHANNYSWPPISSHRAACRHYWPVLQTVLHAVHTGPTCTANHWEIAVHLVTGHDDRLQNVRRTHHRDGQLPMSVDMWCDERSSMKWCSRRSRLWPACEGRALTRPSWPVLTSSTDHRSARSPGRSCRCGCRTGRRTDHCCDHDASDSEGLWAYWLDWRRDSTTDHLSTPN